MDPREKPSSRWPRYDDTNATIEESRELARRRKPLHPTGERPLSHETPRGQALQSWTSSALVPTSYASGFRGAVRYPHQPGDFHGTPGSFNASVFQPGNLGQVPESLPKMRPPSMALQTGSLPASTPRALGGSKSPLRASLGEHPWEVHARRSDSDRPGRLSMDARHGEDRSAEVTYPQRRPSNRDEFDGPHQYLAKLDPEIIAAQEQELPSMLTQLASSEQDDILSQVHTVLALCAYNFVAKYQFPIPLEPDKRPVKTAADREWTEWVFLIKRLATKRRIPARVLYNGQIKQLVTILENSLEMRHAAKHLARPLKDDRNVLQLISAGIQVAKILKDASAMRNLDHIYTSTEDLIQTRRTPSAYLAPV